jgi:hypothetical protein
MKELTFSSGNPLSQMNRKLSTIAMLSNIICCFINKTKCFGICLVMMKVQIFVLSMKGFDEEILSMQFWI